MPKTIKDRGAGEDAGAVTAQETAPPAPCWVRYIGADGGRRYGNVKLKQGQAVLMPARDAEGCCAKYKGSFRLVTDAAELSELEAKREGLAADLEAAEAKGRAARKAEEG